MAKSNTSTERRKARVRRAIIAKGGRPRLSVFRSSKQIYAQVIDDEHGRTLAAASSLEKAMREQLKTGATVEAARSRRQGDRRAGEEGRRREGRVRPGRLHVSRPRQGAGRGRARGRPRVLMATEASGAVFGRAAI